MIFSGWILPDFFEARCISCSTSYGHIQIVKHYLNNLRKFDSHLYDIILYKWHICSQNYNHCDVDDLAVNLLGWIKVNDNPMRCVFYSENCDDFLTSTAKKYENFGYNCIGTNLCKEIIVVDIPSKQLIE